METCKILSILCFIISTICARGLQPTDLTDEGPAEQSSKMGTSQDMLECPCFPESESGIRISEYISLYGEPQERLVLYIYKYKNSNEFSVYIPNGEKQLLFPDLSYDVNEVIERITPGTYVDFFNIKKKYFPIISSDKEITLQPLNDLVVNATVPINITYPSQQDVSDDQAQPEALDLPEYSNQLILPGSPGRPMSQIPHSNKKTPPSEHHKHRPSNDLSDSMFPIIFGTTLSHKLNHPLKKQKQPTETLILPQIIIESSADGPKPANNKLVSADNLGITPEAVKPNKDDTMVFIPPFQQPSQIILSNDSPSLFQDPTRKHPNVPKILNSDEPVKGYLNNFLPKDIDVSSPESMNLLNPSWIHITLPNNAYQHPIFENWFINQIRNVHSKRPSISNLINFPSLKLLLKKALYNNGIRLSNTGLLYDSNGNILDIGKLKLRPILLGNPLDYEKLIASKKCVTPYDIPYLEAILVTLTYPPKVLAIIPLRSISISKPLNNIILPSINKIVYGKPNLATTSNYYNQNNAYPAVITNNVEWPNSHKMALSSKTGGENEQVTLNKSSNEVKDNNAKLNAGNQEVSRTVITPITQVANKHKPKWDAEYYLEEKVSSDDVKNSTLKVDTQGVSLDVITPVSQVANKHNIKWDEENVLGEKISTEDIDVPQEVTKYPEDKDYDMLDYRIVGGNPATSSGTPVSSRGRSGIRDKIIQTLGRK